VNQFIKDYFSFNKRERNGIFILLIILMIVVAIPFVLPYLIPKGKTDFSQFKKEISAFEKSLKENSDTSYAKDFDFNHIDKSSAETILHPFPFNPNDLSEEKWKELGFDEKQIKTIKNFEAKGGKFYKKEDLEKIYGISASEYAVLEPYIQIPDENKSYSKKEKQIFKSDKNTTVIELNSADTTELKKLKGIGTWFAKKIIAYRTKLGGFFKKEQLLEVKGMDSTKYAAFCDYVSVNKYLVKTLNVNTADFDDLKSHPYIGYNIALSLTNLRQVHGKFSNVAAIKQSVLVTEKVYEKISPYLSID
jgi:competence protein ComEA